MPISIYKKCQCNKATVFLYSNLVYSILKHCFVTSFIFFNFFFLRVKSSGPLYIYIYDDVAKKIIRLNALGFYGLVIVWEA